MSLSLPITQFDSEGVKWAKLQRLFRLIADNAGITYTMSFPLTDILPSDSEGTKWTKLGAWTQLIADNIGAGGGGAGLAVSGVDNSITSWAQLAAIVTAGATLPVIKVWFDSAAGIQRTTRAIVGGDATDTANGIQRADDFATSGVVWYEI